MPRAIKFKKTVLLPHRRDKDGTVDCYGVKLLKLETVNYYCQMNHLGG